MRTPLEFLSTTLARLRTKLVRKGEGRLAIATYHAACPLTFEALEDRTLFTVSPWHNETQALDVNGDLQETAADVFQIVDHVRAVPGNSTTIGPEDPRPSL